MFFTLVPGFDGFWWPGRVNIADDDDRVRRFATQPTIRSPVIWELSVVAESVWQDSIRENTPTDQQHVVYTRKDDPQFGQGGISDIKSAFCALNSV